MEYVIKALILFLFLFAVFGRSSVTSPFIYWAVYPVMFILVLVYWIDKYYVGRKRNERQLNEPVTFSLFVGKVPLDAREDLERGRLSIVKGRIVLVRKMKGNTLTVNEQGSVSDVKSISFGKVIGVRRGFTFYFKDGSSISYAKLFRKKKRADLYRALDWDIKKA